MLHPPLSDADDYKKDWNKPLHRIGAYFAGDLPASPAIEVRISVSADILRIFW